MARLVLASRPLPLLPSPDISSPAFKANPYPFYARLRAEAPVHRTRLALWLRAWLVTRYDDVVFVLKEGPFSNDFLAQRMGWLPRRLKPLTRHMLSADPPDHIRLRALVSKAFTPRAVERLGARMQEICDARLDAAQREGRLDVVRDYALPLPLTVIAEMLGIPEHERRRFAGWGKAVAAGGDGSVTHFLMAVPALLQSTAYLRDLIARRRAQPGDDIVTALLQAEEAGDRLSEDEVIGMIALLILAGYETTMGLVSAGTLALLQNPEQRRRFVDEPTLTDPAIEELLRHTSPLEFAAFRLAREAVTIAGVTIPKGDVVLAALGSANHDESRFPDPNTLDIARASNGHVAFGAGAHFCLGAPLARLEAKIALTTLFRRFPELRLGEPANEVPWRRGLFFRGPARLRVVL
jgi:cytochrome P450 PksS